MSFGLWEKTRVPRETHVHMGKNENSIGEEVGKPSVGPGIEPEPEQCHPPILKTCYFSISLVQILTAAYQMKQGRETHLFEGPHKGLFWKARPISWTHICSKLIISSLKKSVVCFWLAASSKCYGLAIKMWHRDNKTPTLYHFLNQHNWK